MRMLALRIATLVSAAGLACAAPVSAQPGPAAPAAAPLRELLAEIKALRVDLNQRLDASIRAQLLVARLQLQEQRIATVSRQLTDVQQQLQQNERGRGPIEAQLKMFEATQAEASGSEKGEGNFVVETLRRQVEQLSKADEELKRQQAYFSGLLAEEQSRWAAFNARLEQLEEALTAAPAARDR